LSDNGNNVIHIGDDDARRTPLDEAVDVLREMLDAGPTRVYDVMKGMARWLGQHDHPEELALQAMKQLGVMCSLPNPED